MRSEKGIYFCGNGWKGMAEREGTVVHSKIHIGKLNHKFMRVVVKPTFSSSRKHLKPIPICDSSQADS